MDGVQLSQGYRATTRRQFTFLPLNPQEYLVLISSILERRKVESTLEPLGDFEPGTNGLGTQQLNH